VPPDFDTASKGYRAAAGQGHAAARCELAESEYSLGLMRYKGTVMARDHVAAAALFRRAADHGHVPALTNLGTCYALGHGGAVQVASIKTRAESAPGFSTYD
jgi:TPR repeat protein